MNMLVFLHIFVDNRQKKQFSFANSLKQSTLIRFTFLFLFFVLKFFFCEFHDRIYIFLVFCSQLTMSAHSAPTSRSKRRSMNNVSRSTVFAESLHRNSTSRSHSVCNPPDSLLFSVLLMNLQMYEAILTTSTS